MEKKKAKVIWLVGTESAPRREKEFNHWYDNTHLPHVLELPGVIGATRYERVGSERHYPTYLSVYEVEDESVIDRILRGEVTDALKKDSEDMVRLGARPVFLAHYKQI